MNTVATVVSTIAGIAAIVLAVLDLPGKIRAFRSSPRPDREQQIVLPSRARGSSPIRPVGRSRWARLRVLGRPVLLALIGALLLVGTFTVGRTTAHPRSTPADGADPITAGCVDGSRIVERVVITAPANHLFGWLELHHSPKCHAGWARIALFTGEPYPTPTPVLDTKIVRPRDGRVEAEHYTNRTNALYTNLLNDQRACVYAEGQVRIGRYLTPVIQTACHQL